MAASSERMCLWVLVAGMMLSRTSHAISLELEQISCDESLPVSVVSNSFQIRCNDRPRCSLNGKDTAFINGHWYFQGLADAGVVDSSASITASVETFNDSYDIVPGRTSVNLCYEDEDDDGNDDNYNNDDDTYNGDDAYSAYYDAYGNDNNDVDACPDDGIYELKANVTLPRYRGTWLGTGWKATANVLMFSYQGKLLGSCELSLKTHTTWFVPSSRFVFVALVPVLSVLVLVGAFIGIRRFVGHDKADDVQDFQRLGKDMVNQMVPNVWSLDETILEDSFYSTMTDPSDTATNTDDIHSLPSIS